MIRHDCITGWRVHAPWVHDLLYSEDIDLVQVSAEPAGPIMDALPEVLDPWLGKAQWKQTQGRVTLASRVATQDSGCAADCPMLDASNRAARSGTIRQRQSHP